jgi:hypothetical protein
MSQHDYVIANGTGAAVRSDLNNALAAIVSQNSGATAPATTYAYMWWADTTTGLLKIRNAANNAWVTIGSLSTAGFGLLAAGDTLTAALGSASTPGITFTGDLNTGIYSPGADQVAVATNGTGRLFVDSNGRVLVGTSTSLSTNAGFTPNLQVAGTVTDAAMSVFQYRNATGAGGSLTLSHSRGASVGTQTILQNGDSFGILLFEGSDGTNPVQGALIKGEVDGTPGTNDMPGRIVLSTTADGASSPTERMRIDSSGKVGIGTNSASKTLHVYSSSFTFPARIETNGTGSGIELKDGTTGANAPTVGAIGDNFYVTTNNTERFRCDSSGRLLVGTSTTDTSYYDATTFVPQIQLKGSTADASSISLTRTSTTGAAFVFQSGSSGNNVASGGLLGEIIFSGYDGANYRNAARIETFVDATPGSGDMPGRLVFSTTADGASSPTERMRIDSAGTTYFLSTANTIGALTTVGAGTSTRLYYGSHSASGISGTISYTVWSNGNVVNTNNSYGSISDIKLKENIVDAGSQWNDLKALQVRKYNFKEETNQQTHTQIGLVAQEVELVSPGLVSESPDRDDEGNDLGTVTKSVNYSVLYMKAVKALQEAMGRIEQLETEMAAVKAQLS